MPASKILFENAKGSLGQMVLLSMICAFLVQEISAIPPKLASRAAPAWIDRNRWQLSRVIFTACLPSLIPDMASLLQAVRNAGANNVVILGAWLSEKKL